MIRRSLLQLGAGAAAGLVFSPAPWRILGDTAIWTQNWSLRPSAPRGPREEKEGRCTLCPAACGATIRTCSGVPFQSAPRDSAMCPAGLVGHQLAHHPLRLRECLHRSRPAQVEDALAAVRQRIGDSGRVLILDLLPGRTASYLHRMYAGAIPGAVVAEPPAIEGGTAAALSQLLGEPVALSAHLPAVKTVLSVSTPLLDGWAAPAIAAPGRRAFRLWQADVRPSRSATLAEEAILLRPGQEAVFLLALFGVLAEDAGLRRKVEGLPGYEQAAQAAGVFGLAGRAGVPAERLRALANALRNDGPAIVVADGDPVGGPLSVETRSLAAAINAMLGAAGFRRRTPAPVPPAWTGSAAQPLAAIPDESVSVLLIDEPAPGLTLPWSLVESKLRPDATVVALTWNHSSFANHAEWLVPVPAFLEAQQDAPPACDTAAGCFAVSPALLAPPAAAIHAADFVAKLAGGDVAFADRMTERLKLMDASETLFWTSSQAPAACGPFARLLPEGADLARVAAEQAEVAGPVVIAHGWRQATVSPLLAKLWQESDLRPAVGEMQARPETLDSLQLRAGAASLVNGGSRVAVKVSTDRSAPPGILEVCHGPGCAQIATVEPDGTWRLSTAKVVAS